MKRHFSYLLWLAFSVGFILLFAFNSQAATLHFLYANNSAWKSERVIVASSDITIDAGQLYPPQTIPAGSERLESFGPAGFGVLDLHLVSGSGRGWTEASFDDGKTTNSVEIPPLPEALTETGVYSFEAIRSGNGRSTYLLFLPASNGQATAVVSYFDATNTAVGSESFDVPAFQKLSLPLTIGRIEVRLQGSKLGAPGLVTGSFYVVAFVGRDSGKPRVEVPTLKP